MRWQFSIKHLLLVTAVFGICAFFAKRDRDQRLAREQLDAMGVAFVAFEDLDAHIPCRQHSDISAKAVLRVRCIREDGSAVDLHRIAKHAERLNFAYGISVSRCPDPLKLSMLSGFRSLRMLVLGGTRVTDWDSLANFPKLEGIVFDHNTSLDHEALKAIAIQRQIHWLDLTGCGVSDDDVEMLSRHLDLTSLVLRNTSITEKSFVLLCEQSKLRVLDISRSYPISEHTRALVSRISHSFRRYNPWYEPREREETGQVTDLDFPESLVWLDCSGWDFTAATTRRLSRLPQLEYLNLSGHSLNMDEVKSLTGLTALKHFGLADTHVEDGDILRSVAKLENLRTLDLRGVRVSTDVLCQIAKLPNLDVLLVAGPGARNGVSEATMLQVLPLLAGKTVHIDNLFAPLDFHYPQILPLLFPNGPTYPGGHPPRLTVQIPAALADN